MRSILKYITGRVLITAIVVLIQLALIVMFYMGLWNCSIYVECLLRIISLAFAVIVYNSDSNPAFKTSWIVVILIIPLGWILYITFHGTRNSRRTVLKYQDLPDLTEWYSHANPSVLESLSEHDFQIAKMCKYVQNVSGMGVFNNTSTRFYPCGECFFMDFIESLKASKRYIFLEYFIVAHGTMWNTVLDILIEKAKQGVEVRIIYDDMGTISMLKHHYDDYLKSLGIKTLVFNPIEAFPNPSINFRDHRKITIIDGKVAYTGGLNLSDEYINRKERFGYWKDSALRLEGEAVQSMIKMYLQLWNYCTYEDYGHDLNEYFSYTDSISANGYVLPFYDNPFNKRLISEYTYMGIIQSARKYVYICTPYLILDNEMVTALKYASISGVDVRIITPHIPDKKNVNEVTRSNYLELLNSGVRIFEFRDGFIHSKTIVSDDRSAIVGTANFDFRSFYMHFENGVLLYNTDSVMQVKQDCLNVFDNQSIEILKSDCLKLPLYKKIVRLILRLFSPMM